MDLQSKKIFVGLSGGVDSAVSAALLQRAGAKVTGVYIKGWYPPGMPCTWAGERRDAMRVAARLHIPFITLDASSEYKHSVIDYMLSEYRAGRTPNPDIMCNREVKFGAFYRFAKEHGADAIATGHYRNGTKNQSYFLWAVAREALLETIFPVGQMEKPVVRVLAKRFKLPVAQKRDSQGVCFLGSISIDEFLRSQFGEAPGEAFDTDGTLMGTHDGVLFHTIGERVALKGAVPGPWFVIAKDIPENRLVVSKGHRIQSLKTPTKIRFSSANWIGNPTEATTAQYRYRGTHVPGRVEGDWFLATESLPELPAPGQSIVFYQNHDLIGGGIIEP